MKELRLTHTVPKRIRNSLVIKPRLFFLVLILLLTGCAISLAPKFDQNIIDSLSTSSVTVFQLISKVSDGTSKDDFDKRKDTYDNIIGTFEALELQINARPLPNNKLINKIIDKTNDRLTKGGTGTLITANTIAPSATALEQVVKNLNKMENDDKTNGLIKESVAVYKKDIQLYLDQALTYERALNK